MEKTMKIQKLLAIQDRQYNDQQGHKGVYQHGHGAHGRHRHSVCRGDRRLRPLACGTSE